MGRETAIRGLVRRQGRPFEGAYLSLSGGSGEFVGEVRSDAEGRFELYAGPGDWTLTCLVTGAGRKTQQLTLKLGEQHQMEFEV
jgi:hypothetical protein